MLLVSDRINLMGAGSVHGNVSCADAMVNLSRLRSFFKRDDVRLGRGADLPLVEDPRWFTEWRSQYKATLPFEVPVSLPTSAQLMIDLVRAHPGKVTILSIGPLTNLALAARLEPDFISQVKEVIAMGGSYGTSPDTPEFNLRCDPEAAHIVFCAGWKLTLLGLNLTRRVVFHRQEFAELKGNHPATRLLKDMAPTWIDRMEKMGWEIGGCALHDAVAVAYILDSSLFERKETGVRVELQDKEVRGKTHFFEIDSSMPRAGLVVDMDLQSCHDFIWSHIQDCEE
jgi:inosine-uridine nucleoside N-ribohydrolase